MTAAMMQKYINLIILTNVIWFSWPQLGSANEPSQPQRVQLQATVSDLKKAIQEKNFSRLQSDALLPEQRKPIEWRRCGKGKIADLSFAELAKHLSEIVGSQKIKISEYPEYLLGNMIIETERWAGKFPYINFYFSHFRDGFRLKKIIDCTNTYPDIGSSKGKEVSSELRILKQAIDSRKFDLLGALIPTKRTYSWGYCEPGDIPPEELYFDEVAKKLVKDLHSARIALREPIVEKGHSDVLFHAFIDSEGWAGDYKYLTFNFELRKSTGRWEWTGVCESISLERTDMFRKMERGQ